MRPPAKSTRPVGDLALDAAAPIITATIAGVPVRLRVDPGQWDTVELNPDFAARLILAWDGDRDMQIGRVTLAGRTAQTILEVGGAKQPVLVAEHGHAIVSDADGVVGPDLLPFATIAWRQPAAPPPTDTRVLPLDLAARTGLTATDASLAVAVQLRFSLMRPLSEATAAAGSLLAQRYGGRFEGPATALPVLFGITRPARPLRLDRPPLVAGFRLATIPVRIRDFRGDNPLPSDPATQDNAIVVAGKDNPQGAQSWITFANDRLSACAEITYRASPRTLTLACAFDR